VILNLSQSVPGPGARASVCLSSYRLYDNHLHCSRSGPRDPNLFPQPPPLQLLTTLARPVPCLYYLDKHVIIR